MGTNGRRTEPADDSPQRQPPAQPVAPRQGEGASSILSPEVRVLGQSLQFWQGLTAGLAVAIVILFLIVLILAS